MGKKSTDGFSCAGCLLPAVDAEEQAAEACWPNHELWKQ